MAIKPMQFEAGRGRLAQLSGDGGLAVVAGGYELSRDFVIKVSGELEVTESVGIGPFRKDRRTTQRFNFSINQAGEIVEPCHGVRFKVTKATGGWVVTGKLRGIDCYFGEFPFDAPEESSFNFVMLSILGTVLRGKAVLAQHSLEKQRYMA